MGGASEVEGRVELCLDGEWGTICDNFWSTLDAVVVCNQLNLGKSDALAIQGARFGPGTGRIFLNNFFCLGTESSLTDCTHTDPSTSVCVHDQDASVRCSGANIDRGFGEGGREGRCHCVAYSLQISATEQPLVDGGDRTDPNVNSPIGL